MRPRSLHGVLGGLIHTMPVQDLSKVYHSVFGILGLAGTVDQLQGFTFIGVCKVVGVLGSWGILGDTLGLVCIALLCCPCLGALYGHYATGLSVWPPFLFLLVLLVLFLGEYRCPGGVLPAGRYNPTNCPAKAM